MRTLFLALVWLAVRQVAPPPAVPPPVASSLHDRVVEVVLDEKDPVLPGHGACERVEHEVRFSGTLHVWTKAEGGLDTFLRVEDGEGKLLAEDDDSGGKPTPYVKLEVEPGRKLAIAVAAAKPGGTGKVELHLVAALETETTRAEAERAKQEIAETKRLREAKDLAAARTRAEALVEHLVGVEGGVGSELVAKQAWLIGFETDALSLLRPTEGAWRLALSHRTRTLSDDHPDLARARGNLAFTIRALGDLAGARSLEEKVLEVYSRTLPDDHPDLQRTRLNLAAVIKELGDLAAARALEEKVLEVRSRTLPDDHPDLQKARFNLATTLYLLGDLAAARPLQQKVLEVYSRTLPDDHPDLQRARSNLATTIYALGDLAAARALFEQVLDVFSRTLPVDHPDLQSARSNLAATIYALGDLAAARALLEKILDVRARALPDDHPDLQEARLNLAVALHELGDLAAARALFEKVLEVESRTLPDDHPNLQRARLNFAATIAALGDRATARALLEKVLEVESRTLPDDHPELQRARSNLAVTIQELGDLAGARALEEKVLEVRSRTLPEDHPDLQNARSNLATTIHALGDLATARALFEKTLEVQSRTLPDDHIDLQRTRGCLAITIASLAAAGGKEGERRREEEAGKEMFGLLTLAFTRGLCRSAVTAIADASSREAEERIASRGDELGLALSLAAGLGVFPADAELARQAFLLSEATRGAAQASAGLARRARGDERYGKLRKRLRAASEEISLLAQGGGNPDEFRAAVTRRDEAARELVSLARKFSGGGVGLVELDLGSLAARISPREALVAYRRYPRTAIEAGDPPKKSSSESLCAFVVREREKLQRVELGPIDVIEKAIEDWRIAIGAGPSADPGRGTGVLAGSASTSTAGGETVRKLVFDPLRPALQGVERVVVALDDVLHALPLDVLHEGEGLLGEKLHIEYRTSLWEILLEPWSGSGDSILVAVGDVDYGGESRKGDPDEASSPALAGASLSRSSARAGILRGGAWEAGFAPLPATREEARGIAALFRDSFGKDSSAELLEGREASRERLVSNAPRARFLHLATHGWFAPDSVRSWADPQPIDKLSGLARRMGAQEQVKGASPMVLCGLALAGANLPANAVGRFPGLVTAEEIASWDLSSCELAVLSACDTNVGERRAGQGVASLQKALQMAGARTVITSLWKVPDEATKELMLDLYRRIWVEKKPKAQALWEAKMKLRNAKDESGKPKYSTRDWAAWVLTGDPR